MHSLGQIWPCSPGVREAEQSSWQLIISGLLCPQAVSILQQGRSNLGNPHGSCTSGEFQLTSSLLVVLSDLAIKLN